MRTKQAFPGQEGAGLSRLEWYAGMFLMGTAASPYDGMSPSGVATTAFAFAEAMEVEADRIQKERSKAEEDLEVRARKKLGIGF